MTNKILIVDDQPGIRMLLEEILKSEGYEIVTAKTGKQACEMMEAEKPDLTIMDYNLPVMNGHEVLKTFDEMSAHNPVIIITGSSEDSIKEHTQFSFVQEIIAKPFDIHKMKEVVTNTLVRS
ncbi:response regulator [Halobacillus salinarum]|uniref:Response regulator n=1 Tax=Halobacillus salinarum TaxID=2932257 RepID=A0ABY4ET74_9BACI|nr:response regulator [Halobacillus salinarum]UOQ45326.1 response regulator [Halobacillus salinarum]